MIIQWLILATAVIVLLYIGYASKKETAEIESNNKFLVGGNKVGVFVGALSVLATGYSGWGFIGSTGMAYQFGAIEILGNLLFAPAIMLGTFCGAKFLKNQNHKTIPEFLAESHPGSQNSKNLVRVFSAVVSVVLLLVYLTAQIRAIGMVAHAWLNISPLVANIIFMCIVAIITVQGGILAVARTDMIMCVGMVVSSLIIAFIIFKDMSLSEMVTGLASQNIQLVSPSDSHPYGGNKFSVYLIFCYAFLFTTSLPYMSSRFLSFQKDIKSHELILVMAPVALILSIVPFAGLYMRIKSPNLSNPDYAMSAFLNTYVPEQISGLITLFILFAMLSTVSSILHSVVSSLAYDVRKALNIPMTKNSFVNALAVIGVSVAGLALTTLSPTVMLNKVAIIGTGGLISMLAGPTLSHFLLPSNAWTAFVSMFTGISVNIVLSFFSNLGWVEIPVYSSLSGMVVYLVLSAVLRFNSAQRLDLQ